MHEAVDFNEQFFNAGRLRTDFYEWLLDNVGFGYNNPIRGWNAGYSIEWMWYDNRRHGDTQDQKFETSGVIILFMDPRRATYAKLFWGGAQDEIRHED